MYVCLCAVYIPVKYTSNREQLLHSTDFIVVADSLEAFPHFSSTRTHNSSLQQLARVLRFCALYAGSGYIVLHFTVARLESRRSLLSRRVLFGAQLRAAWLARVKYLWTHASRAYDIFYNREPACPSMDAGSLSNASFDSPLFLFYFSVCLMDSSWWSSSWRWV